MLIIGHTAIGITTGLLVQNPWMAFSLGLVSHHLADAIPHFDPGSFYTHEPWRLKMTRDYVLRDWIFVSLDVIFTLIFLIAIWRFLPPDRWGSLTGGLLGANLPDIVHNVPFWSRQLREIGWIAWWQDVIHRRFQITVPAKFWYFGLLPQAAVIAVTIWLVVS